MQTLLSTPAAHLFLAGIALLAPAATAQELHGKDVRMKEAPAGSAPVKGFDPSFDYTNLPPSNEDLWAPLVAAQVTLEQALEVAQEAEGAPVRPLAAEMKLGSEPTWHLQLFVGEPGTAPRRVNVRVSSREPRVLKRMELREVVEAEVSIWKLLEQYQVTPALAISLAKERMVGNKAEPTLVDVRARRLVFVPEKEAMHWKLEVMGFENKGELPRRREVEIDALKPIVRQNLMLDRFAGEPLRAATPTALPNGLWIHDFLVGDGEELTLDSRVEVNYRLFLLDMRKLHDTTTNKKPETFVVGQAPLKGMTQGMLGMRVGGKRKIAIPYALAFGEQGNELAPPRAMVVCDITIERLLP